MKFYGLALLLGIASAANAAPALLIGDGEASEKELRAAVGPLGTLNKINRDRFYPITLSPGVSRDALAARLKAKGVEFVFDGSALNTGTGLFSLQNRIAYLESRYELMRGEAEGETKPGENEETGVDFYEALEHYKRERVGKDGKFDTTTAAQALAHRDKMPPARLGAPGSMAPTSVWENVGPKNCGTPYTIYMTAGPVSGRKNGVAYAPSNTNVIYTASAGGGLWKTSNGGTTWTAMSDKWPNLYTSCVAVHPTDVNTVYVGTGDYEGFFNKLPNGIMKSTDGGSSWTNIGHWDFRFTVVSKIIIDPTNPNILVVTTGQDGNEQSGIYRSADAGATWTRTNAPAGNWDDLDISTSGVYYACYTKAQTTGGLYKSTDKGATWTAITNPNSAAATALDIACSKVNANTLYMLGIGDEAIYKSTNGGTSWTDITGNFPTGLNQQGQERYNWSQKDYDYHISTSKDGTTDMVYVGLITVALSRGGTTTWTDISRTYQQTAPNHVHSDQHCFAMNPSNPNQVIFGCDGGLFRYTWNPASQSGTFAPLNANITDHQFYHMSVYRNSDVNVQGGCQDNFTPAARGNFTNWAGTGAGDGFWSDYDYANNGQHFTTNQNGGFIFYTSLTDPTPDYFQIDLQQYPKGFSTVGLYAGTGSQIFTAGNTLLRRNGTSWVNYNNIIANDSQTQVGIVNHMAVAPSDKTIVYTGSNNGEIFRSSTNGGATFVGNDSDFRPVGAIGVHWTNPNDIIVGFKGPNGGRLYRTTNANAATPTWVQVQGSGVSSFPDTPVNCIARDPYEASRWYVGTDIGVFMTNNNGASWFNMNALGLPNVHVNSLQFNGPKTYLYAGTFGRGIWRIKTGASGASFSVSGTVRTAANAAYPNVTMSLSKLKDIPIGTSNVANLLTQPQTEYWVPINVSANVPITRTDIFVDYVHQFPSDVQIAIYNPQGEGLWLSNNDPMLLTANIIKTFTKMEYNGKRSNGTWQLYVRNNSFFTLGRLRSVRLTTHTDGYQQIRTTTTNASGVYTLPALEAGYYLLRPVVTGKTWTPASRTFTLGPSLTAQDFKANN